MPRRRNPIDQNTVMWGLGLAAVVGGGYYLYTQSKAAGALPGTTNVVLASGSTQQTVPVPKGNTVDISLPAGGTWTPGNASGANNQTPASGSADITWPYQGPGTIVLGWTDSAGTAQSTQIVLTNA